MDFSVPPEGVNYPRQQCTECMFVPDLLARCVGTLKLLFGKLGAIEQVSSTPKESDPHQEHIGDVERSRTVQQLAGDCSLWTAEVGVPTSGRADTAGIQIRQRKVIDYGTADPSSSNRQGAFSSVVFRDLISKPFLHAMLTASPAAARRVGGSVSSLTQKTSEADLTTGSK
ncbi:hypothetical protein AYL99_11677 [Fonsecaea erecta]|uniref:Uncharacterized protein n=1 Tax=Fonsecaea erecta TaxID=1367422 RepID=A0A178Z2Z0_9EURO|nr:hypothetical protein AYL99_11677 [Fonsecaea erecta]OAP54142.1 hypothetical protein AYL99_11677 [Fonsecaea erecta]